MGRKVRYKTYKGMKCKEVYYDNSVDTIYQPIVEVGKGFVKVVSRAGKEYWVQMSDRVEMTMHPKKRDTAVIKTFPDKWLVVDICEYEEEEKPEIEVLMVKKMNGGLTDEEQERLDWLKKNDEDYLRQVREMNDILGSY